MRIVLCILSLVLAAGLGNGSPGNASEWECPQQIETEQTLESVPGSWAAGKSQYPSTLKIVYIYDGPPEQLAVLAASNKGSNDNFYLYTLDKENPRQYWIACVYRNTHLMLSKPLPKGLKSCKVTHDNKIYCE
ncbi:STY0301 family protein [uncultured Desulfosarcina sp.]|uniref:STY0301 family protein n=1 Tax=uncultured Desulfosarcina sp. TaxID=218289 RepID=UPI0029C80D81|nr:STY0301 family protein [uncultured Desulfosarcina sp.]